MLAKRDENYEIVAIEPHKSMSAELEKKNLKGVVIKDGDSQNMPIEEGWGDALVAAQVRAHSDGYMEILY